MSSGEGPPRRSAPIDLRPEEFRAIAHVLVDRISEFLASLASRPVTPRERPSQVRALLPPNALPESGTGASELINEVARLLFDHSLLNGHPRFWGYISSSAAPIGALADLLAATVNPNVGGWGPAPVATEIEAQTVRWIAQLIGYPSDCGGLLVSGGNMANFVGILAARAARAGWDVRKEGVAPSSRGRLRLYASREAHTWIQKAADLFGFGIDAIGWIDVDERQRMIPGDLRRRVREDRSRGYVPFAAVGTAGSVSTGAIDPLPELAEICREEALWFHVDGAYGALAASVPGVPADLRGLCAADSVAVDPHKWLYAPLEAGCALVRDASQLHQTFWFRPPYYRLDEEEPAVNYHEYGPQNSRGFRALKVWLALRQVGRVGYAQMIGDDISLAQALAKRVKEHPQLELHTQSLSITTFRYLPTDLRPGAPDVDAYLNALNTALLGRLQATGKAYVSNAIVREAFLLRACIVNFRTTESDLDALCEIVVDLGNALDEEMRPPSLADSR